MNELKKILIECVLYYKSEKKHNANNRKEHLPWNLKTAHDYTQTIRSRRRENHLLLKFPGEKTSDDNNNKNLRKRHVIAQNISQFRTRPFRSHFCKRFQTSFEHNWFLSKEEISKMGPEENKRSRVYLRVRCKFFVEFHWRKVCWETATKLRVASSPSGGNGLVQVAIGRKRSPMSARQEIPIWRAAGSRQFFVESCCETNFNQGFWRRNDLNILINDPSNKRKTSRVILAQICSTW